MTDYVAQCKGCWRAGTIDEAPVCKVCWGPFKWGVKHIMYKWRMFKNNAAPMLWSVFGQAEIYWNSAPTEFEPRGGLLPTFDVVIPEYRIVIDFFNDDQMIPADIHLPHSALESRLKADSLKTKMCWDNNYRHYSLPMDIDTARNKLVSLVNEIYLLDRDGERVQILNPKKSGDAGWDLVCDEDVTVQPGEGKDIPSQVRLEIPNHLYAVVHARSSTSKKRLLVLPGVIDAGYRGQVFTMVFNPTTEPIKIDKDARISQMLFLPRTTHLHIDPVDDLRPSQRGSKGFGSTGI